MTSLIDSSSADSSSAAAAEEVDKEKAVAGYKAAPCQRQRRLRRRANLARSLVAGVAAATVAAVSLLAVALPSTTTEGARDPPLGSRDPPAALVWQLKKFSGRAVLSDTFSSSSPAAAAALLSSSTVTAEEKDSSLFSSFLSPVEEFDEESARLGVEPFSSLAADTVAALSSSSSPFSSSSSGSLPPGLWHLDRLDARALPLDGAAFDPSKAGFPKKGKGVTIYVVDSGVSVGHSEFLERGGDGSSSRASEGPDFSSAADGGGGVLFPLNSNSSSSSPAPLLGDCDGHGTHVASLAAGKDVGVAPAARVVSLRVLGCDGAGRASSLVGALRFVAREGSKPAVVVLSLGGGGAGSGAGSRSGALGSERAAEAIDAAALEALEAGAVVVAAAGNAGGDACNSSPGRLPGIITVGGSDLPLGDKFPRLEKERGTKAAREASPAAAAVAPAPPRRSDGGGGGGALGQILSESSPSSSPSRRGSRRRSLLAEGGGKEPLYPYSNTGPCVTLFAPGSDLLAACGGGTGAGKRRCPDPSLPFAAAWSSGTSMSAPLVAGAAALILGERPNATPAEVKAELVSRATEGVLDFANSPSRKPEVLPGTPNKLLYLGPV